MAVQVAWRQSPCYQDKVLAYPGPSLGSIVYGNIVHADACYLQVTQPYPGMQHRYSTARCLTDNSGFTLGGGRTAYLPLVGRSLVADGQVLLEKIVGSSQDQFTMPPVHIHGKQEALNVEAEEPWQPALDAAGERYYWHKHTKQTRWDDPDPVSTDMLSRRCMRLALFSSGSDCEWMSGLAPRRH